MPNPEPTLEKIRKEFEKEGIKLHPPTWRDTVYSIIRKVVK